MTERRPFPPSPRRLALARLAGLTAVSPLLVGALACGAAILAAVMLARAAAALVGDAIAAACNAASQPADVLLAAASEPARLHTTDAGSTIATAAPRMTFDNLALVVLDLAAPLLAATAVVAFVVHVAQTRAVWLPRRRVPGAPGLAPARTRHASFEIIGTSIVGVVAFGWLWTTAPRLAGLFALPRFDSAVGSAIASFAVALAIAWVALAILDALARHFELTHALAMTVTEKREDDRLAAADPRWRAQRLALARGPSARDAVARSTLVLLGDDVAVAIAYDARRQPVPLRTITGRGPRATQLLGLARRHHIAVHRDAALAAELVDGDGPVPDTHWTRLADILAAVQRTNL